MCATCGCSEGAAGVRVIDPALVGSAEHGHAHSDGHVHGHVHGDGHMHADGHGHESGHDHGHSHGHEGHSHGHGSGHSHEHGHSQPVAAAPDPGDMGLPRPGNVRLRHGGIQFCGERRFRQADEAGTV